MIVDTLGQYVGLLTGGWDAATKTTDITYATPFEWIWRLVREEFPDATLDFEGYAMPIPV